MQAISNGDTGLSVRNKLNADLNTSLTVLTDGASVSWDCNNRKLPMAKLTSTQSFTINMTNVLDGAQGVLKLTTGTASAITITFDTDFTNKIFNQSTPTYTLPAGNSQEYFFHFIVDGTTIEWIIIDGVMPANPFARVRRISTTQSIDATGAALTFDTEDNDNNGIWTAGDATKLTIPGSGSKIAFVDVYLAIGAVSGTATNIVRIQPRVNGSIVYGTLHDFPDIGNANKQAHFLVPCSGGDYITVYCSSTITKSVNARANITVFNV